MTGCRRRVEATRTTVNRSAGTDSISDAADGVDIAGENSDDLAVDRYGDSLGSDGENGAAYRALSGLNS